MKEQEYRQCSISVMDTIADPDITFDDKGISNYYYEYKQAEARDVLRGNEAEEKIKSLVSEIKNAGSGRPYDCLIGVSGGVDSTYVAYLVKKLGLRPLAVHLDNGWNSELAVKNIESLVNKLGIDLYTIVVNWEEFRDIQLSYLKASVVDIEVVSDHAIFAAMNKVAMEKKIQYVINGTNVVTEHVMPKSWLYSKMDYANLKDIHSRYGSVKIKTFPTQPFWRYVYQSAFLRLKSVPILNYVEYNKEAIKELISAELGWRDYGGKHYESIFTKFYQAYILPEKFGIDKRKAHLSNLVFSGQITKAEALEELGKPLYQQDELAADTEYVCKKFGITTDEFRAIMKLPIRPHSYFRSDMAIKRKWMRLLERTKPVRHFFKQK
jgi:N-acetyl sugar amidotransferase